jgi:thiol:disulfide interchange protein
MWEVILLALLGGLILNLMPCVLPVLAIKVFGITELAQRERREMVVHGFAYTGGILLSMLVLAATVVALRAAGTAVGWGFQFQEPLFVAAISAVLLVFALNLFGVFDIYIDATRLSQVGQTGSGARRSFFEGLLAVAVATPCSAPFLGTAVGFAFASSTIVIVAVFLAVGLGLASPYLVVTWVPGWAKLIPRSGPWMIQLRQGLAFLLLGTIVWLLWVIGRSVGVEGMTGLLTFLVAVAFATWIFGALQAAQRTRTALGAALGVGSLAVAWLLALPLEARETRTPDASAAESLEWRAFDPAQVRTELDEGRPVFVYFTLQGERAHGARRCARSGGARATRVHDLQGGLDAARRDDPERARPLRPRRRADVPRLQPERAEEARATAGAPDRRPARRRAARGRTQRRWTPLTRSPPHQSVSRRSRSALLMTETELRLIAAAAIIGLSRSPNVG